MHEIIAKVIAAETEGTRLVTEARSRAAAILADARARAAGLSAAADREARREAGRSADGILAEAALEKEAQLNAARSEIEKETGFGEAALRRAAGEVVRRVLGA